jgi:hypothetical protein
MVDTFDKKRLSFAAYIMIVGPLLIVRLVPILFHIYPFITLEVALQRGSIQFYMYPSKGTTYPVADVHTV